MSDDESMGWLVVYEDAHAFGGTFAYYFRDKEEAVREFEGQARAPHNFVNPRIKKVGTHAPILLRMGSLPEAMEADAKTLMRLIAGARRAFLQGVNTARFGPPCDCCDLDPDQLIAADGEKMDKDLDAIEEHTKHVRRKAIFDAAREAIACDTPDRAVRAILALLMPDSDAEQREAYDALWKEREEAEAEEDRKWKERENAR